MFFLDSPVGKWAISGMWGADKWASGYGAVIVRDWHEANLLTISEYDSVLCKFAYVQTYNRF